MDNLGDLNWALIVKKHGLISVLVPKIASTKIRTLLILMNREHEDVRLYDFLLSTGKKLKKDAERGCK